jgi:hypothetical protein
MQDGSFSKLVRFPVVLSGLARFPQRTRRSKVAFQSKKYRVAASPTTQKAGKKWHTNLF